MPIRQASLMLSLDDKGANSRHSCPLMVGVLFGKITLGTMWQHLKVHIHTEALDLTLPPLFMPREITACGQWDTGRGVFMSLLFMLVKNLKQSNCLQRKKIMCVIVMQLNSCNNENVCVCVCARVCSVVSSSLRPNGLWPTRLLCPWNFPGKNTGVGCHFLLQGIFPT